MPQVVKHIRSAVQGKTPTTSELALGCLGINTYDGKLFLKKSTSGNETGAGVSIIEIGASGNQDYGLITGAVDGSLDYGALV